MLKTREFDLRNKSREPFPTIDDAFSRVEEGYLLLRKLREFKHPLAVRRGVTQMSEAMATGETSRVLKAKGRTYFFDIKKTMEGTVYLVVSESRLRRGEQTPYQARIAIFPEDAEPFLDIFQEMLGLVKPQ